MRRGFLGTDSALTKVAAGDDDAVEYVERIVVGGAAVAAKVDAFVEGDRGGARPRANLRTVEAELLTREWPLLAAPGSCWRDRCRAHPHPACLLARGCDPP
jgi:hypothetical protein